MDIQVLKENLIMDNKIIKILESLKMHSIRENEKFISCGMPDGDNPSSTIVYKDNLDVKAYTRNIIDKNGNSDLISLVMFVKNIDYISHAIKFICDICDYNYYMKEKDVPEALKWANEIIKMSKNHEYESEDSNIVPLDESVLNYYPICPTRYWENDNISLETQIEFEVGFDFCNHYITIPIRDEIGTLVGVKGRLYGDYGMKYLYIHRCPKSKILFGLNKTLEYIKKENRVYVFESEKAVMQMWSMGVKNCVAIGSHNLSSTQAKKLIHLDVDEIILCYDKGIGCMLDGDKIPIKKNNKYIFDSEFYNNEFRSFLNGQRVGVMFDDFNILDDKESPSDNFEKFKKMLSKIKFKTIKQEEIS